MFTRPSQITAHRMAQEALIARHQRESAAGDRLARWGLVALLASLVSSAIWSALLALSFEASGQLHTIQVATDTLSRVL